ncbi:RNA polymerase recycling motor ATPase HelR [Gordonia sp. ABSL11-1]|uniref:RNA polymerase recycling motor ATPase HelR n=1 Tax=Gordonia sp. ABSL11-1 TaxID=3053924 RepID=UPI002572A15B|nr:RNA polymerase recycling motor ATPase HelR [Gordonia sp. ABSL11-1]MDL9948353.1 RNA polymerase recycling motor ATPase HelR [Gordonia sp. ABSL11-1]
MDKSTRSAFHLTESRSAKVDPRLIAADDDRFAAITTSLQTSIADLTDRLDALQKARGGHGKEAVERDLEIHQTNARLRTLRRFSVDLCLGRFVPADGTEPVYIGRVGLTDRNGRQLLIDWRTPAAEPFFAATHADPMGVASRRRYRWSYGRITDYWDEALTPGVDTDDLALDDDSAFIAGLPAGRSPRMRDVLGTIAADQDAIIRAGSRGALVVDGGPGTGKTVVALHRAAYLLYADPRLAGNRGGVLVVGPHEPYLGYVADVLPSLGEEGVRTCTLRDLLPEGDTATTESDDAVARVKSSATMVGAIEPAVRFYEEPPTESFVVETPWADVTLRPADWAEAFDAPEAGTSHNDGRDVVWAALVARVADKLDAEVPLTEVGRALSENNDLARAFTLAWPLLEPTDIVADLWSVPAFLRMCVPGMSADDVRTLQRPEPYAWTESDLPLLDAARQRIGDPDASSRRRRRAATLSAERARMDDVVGDLLDSNVHDDGEGVMSMLRGQDLRNSLVDQTAAPGEEPDALAGPFAHIIVDEAQELTDADWQMLLSRCPSRSFTIVGDRAQARRGFTETWASRLSRVGITRVSMASLSVNYRTPEEVMAVAAPVIRAALPDANVPTSIRTSGLPVRRGRSAERDAIVGRWLADNDEGTACVIGDPSFVERPRVRSLSPTHAKGLEFDLVVLVEPDDFGAGIDGAVDRYVAMTRTTRELVVLSDTV